MTALCALLLAALSLTACEPGTARAPHQRSGPPPAVADATAGTRTATGPATGGYRPEALAARDLGVDERRGGHTIERHVGKTDQELRARLNRERRISAASTYTDLETAERVVASTLERESPQVQRWAARDGRRPNLALDYDGDPSAVIGRSLRRGQREPEGCHDAVVVLRWDERQGDYYVLTSYPEVRR